MRSITGADTAGSASEGERAGEEGGQRGTQHLLERLEDTDLTSERNVGLRQGFV